MAKLDKARVQVLDDSGKILKEVDVLTSADSVSFDDGDTFQQKLDKGELKGDDGKSAYQIYVDGLGVGEEQLTEEQWLRSLKGDKGDNGTNGRNIEIRKGENALEIKYSNKTSTSLDCSSYVTTFNLLKTDIFEKMYLTKVPSNVKYIQIKTISAFGINAEGKDMGTVNPSISTLPQGESYPCFGGFDVSKGAYDVSVNHEIVGNMNIKDSISAMIKEFNKDKGVVDINKFMLYISLLDKDKKELDLIFLIMNIVGTGDSSFEWQPLVQLSDLKGEQGIKGDKGDRGDKGEKGDRGEAFTITKTYKSIDEMNKDFGNVNVKEGAFVLIDTGNVEEEDNAKLYVKGKDSFSFITDLSGAKGIKGEQGAKGDKGDAGAKGDKGDTGAKGDNGKSAYDIYAENVKDGDTKLSEEEWLNSLKGAKGDKGDKGKDGDEVRFGETIETAVTGRLFFKITK